MINYDTIGYNGVYGVSDITRPISPIRQPTSTIDVEPNTRGDIIADKIYSDHSLDYLIYLANDTINPLDLASITYNDFNDLMVKAFGSVEYSQQYILRFKNNWDSDDDTISQLYYDGLPPEIKSLYTPVFNYSNQVNGYRRKPLNLTKSTSQIVTYSTDREIEENIQVTIQNNETIIGKGFVTFSSPTTVILNHVIDDYRGNRLVSNAGNLNVSVVSVVDVIKDFEKPYYDPLTAYDYYYKKLITDKQTINVYNPGSIQTITENL